MKDYANLERNEISNDYKWDLTLLFKSLTEYKSAYQECDKLITDLKNMKGHILDNADTLYNYFKTYEKLDRLFSKIYLYSNLASDTDTRSTEYQDLKMQSNNLGQKIENELTFVVPEILAGDEQRVYQMIDNDERLKVYHFAMEEIYRDKPYVLKENEEAILARVSDALQASKDIYYNLHNADINFDVVKYEGKEYPLSESNYTLLLHEKDQGLRKKVFETYYKFYESHKNTMAACYKNKIKANNFYSSVRGFPSSLYASLYSDNIEEEVYHNLIKQIHQNLDKLYDYLDVKRKILNLDELHMYDIYMDANYDEEKYDFQKAKEIVFKALAPLGSDYLKKLERPFKEKWIDIYPNLGKRSGAYQWSCYDSPSYVLLNHNNDKNSVSTMAHELGHAMHSLYSNETQIHEYHDYPIFLAEIASTVNEVLLFDYFYKNAKSKNEKINLLVNFLDMVRTTIFRQTMFAEFEYLMFDKESKGISLTEENLSNTYYELNKLYFGPKVVSDDLIRYEWMRIPHFYTPFYVYKYATGLISALSLAYDIINEVPQALDKYLTFLKIGSSNYPLEILKQAGVDITSEEPFKKAFKMFDEKLQELKNLI